MDERRGVAGLLERMHDATFVVGAERFDGHAQLDRGAAVRGNELVVVEADHVTILLGTFAGLLSTEVMEVTVGRLLLVSLLTWLLLAVIITLAIWYPSRKAARLEPAEALHYE